MCAALEGDLVLHDDGPQHEHESGGARMFQSLPMSGSEPDLLKLKRSDGICSQWCRSVDWGEVRANARAYLNLLLILAIVFLTIFCIIGEMSLPTLYLILIWQAAHVGGFLFDLFRLPSIVGMMFVGFLLRNLMGPVLDPLPYVARASCIHQ